MARVEVGSKQWYNLETLLGESLGEGSKYQIQNIKNGKLMVVEGASGPIQEEAGFVLSTEDVLELTKENNKNVYVRSFNAGTILEIEEA